MKNEIWKMENGWLKASGLLFSIYGFLEFRALDLEFKRATTYYRPPTAYYLPNQCFYKPGEHWVWAVGSRG